MKITGSQKIAVLLFGFSDTNDQTLETIDFFKDLFINRNTGGQNDYWISVSNGNINLDGSMVFGWKYFDLSLEKFLITYPKRNQKINAVKSLFSEFNLSEFKTVVAIPNANVKDGGSSGGVLCNTDVYNNNTFISHELGHALLGLDHSFDDSARKTQTWSQPGEYFDPWDIMSAMNTYSFTHASFNKSGPILNAPLCHSLGWINIDRLYETSALKANQMVILRPFIRPELPGYLAIKINYKDIDNGQDEYYMVELRIKEVWDAGIPGTTILINKVKRGIPYLQSSDLSRNIQDWKSGQTFIDTRNNITIHIENVTSAYATINIDNRWDTGSIIPTERASKTGCITALSRIPQTLEIFWIGKDGFIHDAYWYDVPGSRWQTFQLQAPKASLSGSIAAVSRIPGSIEIFWIGEDGFIHDAYWYDVPEGGWQTFQLQAPKASLSGSIAAVSRIPGSLEIFWIGEDGFIHDAYWYDVPGSGWQTFQLQAPKASLSGGITAVSRIPGSMEIFWIGEEGSIHSAYWYDTPESRWQTFQLAEPGAASLSGGISAVSRIPNSIEVFWIGPNGSIQSANWYEGATWHLSTLSIESTAKASEKGSIKLVSRIPNSIEVFWIGADGSIQDAHWYE